MATVPYSKTKLLDSALYYWEHSTSWNNMWNTLSNNFTVLCFDKREQLATLTNRRSHINYLSSKLLKSKVFERNSAWNIWSIIILNFLLFETVFSHNGEFFSVPCSSSPIIFWYSSFWCFQSRFLAWHVLKIDVTNLIGQWDKWLPINS